MNDEKRLEQAREEYDEVIAKIFQFRIPESLTVDAQWNLSLAMLKLKKTLNPDFNEKKMLMASYKRKS